MVPKDLALRLENYLYNGFKPDNQSAVYKAFKEVCEAAAAAPPSPRSDDGEGKPIVITRLLDGTATVPTPHSTAVSAIAQERDVEVCDLIWDEILQGRSKEDPCKEVIGWEAQTAFNTFYVIEEQTGGWELCHDGAVVSTHERHEHPDAAKAAAQADHAQRIRSSLHPTTSPKAISEAPTSAEAVKSPTPQSIEVGEMVEALKADARYAKSVGLLAMEENLDQAASLLIALDAERGRMREALKKIASCESRAPGDVVDIARSALPASDEG